MTRRNNPDYREPDYISRREDESLEDYIDRLHEALEPRVANHIIRQLLKMIPPGYEDDKLITDARYFISGGGRTDHWKDRDVYFRWSDNNCRFITDREIEEEREKPRIEAAKREALSQLKQMCDAAGCPCHIHDNDDVDKAALLRKEYTRRHHWAIALGPDRFKILLFGGYSSVLVSSEATAQQATEIFVAEKAKDDERKQQLRDERERKKRLRDTQPAAS